MAWLCHLHSLYFSNNKPGCCAAHQYAPESDNIRKIFQGKEDATKTAVVTHKKSHVGTNKSPDIPNWQIALKRHEGCPAAKWIQLQQLRHHVYWTADCGAINGSLIYHAILSIILAMSFRDFSLLVSMYFFRVGISLSHPSMLMSVDLTCSVPIDLLGESDSCS